MSEAEKVKSENADPLAARRLFWMRLEGDREVCFGGGYQYVLKGGQIIERQECAIQAESVLFFLRQAVWFRRQAFMLDGGQLCRFVPGRNALRVVSPIICRTNNFCLAHTCGELRLVDARHSVYRALFDRLWPVQSPFCANYVEDVRLHCQNTRGEPVGVSLQELPKLISHYNFGQFYVQFARGAEENFLTVHEEPTGQLLRAFKTQTRSVIFLQSFALLDDGETGPIVYELCLNKFFKVPDKNALQNAQNFALDAQGITFAREFVLKLLGDKIVDFERALKKCLEAPAQ